MWAIKIDILWYYYYYYYTVMCMSYHKQISHSGCFFLFFAFFLSYVCMDKQCECGSFVVWLDIAFWLFFLLLLLYVHRYIMWMWFFCCLASFCVILFTFVCDYFSLFYCLIFGSLLHVLYGFCLVLCTFYVWLTHVLHNLIN